MKKIIIVLMIMAVGLSSCSLLNLQGIEVINDSESDNIAYVFISPSTDSSWGDNLLGDDDSIAPGESQFFGLTADTYDILLVFDDAEYTGGAYYEIEVGMFTQHQVSMDESYIQLLTAEDSRAVSKSSDSRSLTK
ncbi:MAG: hypothetical protein PQJ61_12780 [Spirochaetales bacterium]|uniref:DUF4397 domain-containing protein n=1 Tax=Candidatus Thalassospirochaeta sargassi TaxID=3119039 RepID=A0AAJ1IE51_9SPIO|nr:hypothetical protein [Spirochaetales bacterium]